MSQIHYSVEPGLEVAEFVDVLVRSTLAERRPVDDLNRVESMLRNADAILCARNEEGLLVGVSRAITDRSFCTYLSDLAVDQAYQGSGIGRELISRTHAEAGKQTMLILLAAPKAQSYYPHIGMKQHGSCWTIERDE